ncbi:hypothetical protein ACE1SV_42620 [Streptomyces sp. E-15]
MRRMRWWLFLLLLTATMTCWECSSAEARQQACWENQLSTSMVDAKLKFHQHGESFVRVDSHLRVEVPLEEWSLARKLTLSKDSADYRVSMHCLLRGPDNTQHNAEWRTHDPAVTETGNKVTVEYDSFAWIKNYQPIQLGPWLIERLRDDTWTVRLRSPTLQKAHWRQVEVDTGGLRFSDLSQRASSSDADTLMWTDWPPGRIAFEIDLPWRRYWLLSYGNSFWGKLGIAAWWVCASALIVLAARRAQRASSTAPATAPDPARPGGASGPKAASGPGRASGAAAVSGRGGNPGPHTASGPDGNPGPDTASAPNTASTPDTASTPNAAFGPGRASGPGDDNNPATAVVQWALVSAAVALMVILLFAQKPPHPQWGIPLCIAAGLTLLLVARPWYGGPHRTARGHASEPPADFADRRRRQARAVIGTAAAVAALGLFVVPAHRLFGLPESLVSERGVGFPGQLGYVLMGLATVWLWLAAMVAWAWRFAREGALLPDSWTRAWDTSPARCVTAVSVLLGVVAGSLLWCARWTSENQWKRVTWLTDPDPVKHRAHISGVMANFAFTDLTWIFSYSWILTVVALCALLRFRVMTQRTKRRHASLGPEGPDLLLTATVFALTAGLEGAGFAGSQAQFSFWLVLNICSLFAVLAVGRRWSVLSRLGDDLCAKRLKNKKRHAELLLKSREYRHLNQQLHLLDQGRATTPTREEVESQLAALRTWLVSGCSGQMPPAHISVLDTALAFGPEGHWWANAVRAARWAFCFGIPASIALPYLDVKESWNLMQLTFEPTAIPQLVATVITYQLAWAGAGFTLGALWRLLPGHHSPARAWSLTFSYAVPAGLTVLLSLFTDVNFRNLLLYSLIMLTILTLTSIWMDTFTLREDRQYWPSRFALLLSVYQLRGVSTHVAWIVAQVAAAVAIFHTLAGS